MYSRSVRHSLDFPEWIGRMDRWGVAVYLISFSSLVFFSSSSFFVILTYSCNLHIIIRLYSREHTEHTGHIYTIYPRPYTYPYPYP